MTRALLVAALVLFGANTVLAADTFYVAKDKAANKCKIVKSEPDGEKLIMVGTASYATKDEAKAAKKAAAECKKSA